MSPIIKIALRRIKNSFAKNILFMLALLFSMTFIAFFSLFELQTILVENSAYSGLPFTEFISRLYIYINITMIFLAAAAFISVRNYCSLRREENKQTLAVLTSVGASQKQKRELIFLEIFVLYLPSVIFGTVIGSILGTTAGRKFQGATHFSAGDLAPVLFLSFFIIVVGIIIILFCSLLPDRNRKQISVIQLLRNQNRKAASERHGYHQSQILNDPILVKRLAKKSADYHRNVYNKISLTFAVSALYPVIAVLLFWSISDAQVVLDTNPFDGIDTSAAVSTAVDHILLFLLILFAALTVSGILQALLMARVQYLSRKKTAYIYLSVGMPEKNIRRMLRAEIRSVMTRSFAVWFVCTALVGSCFMLVK